MSEQQVTYLYAGGTIWTRLVVSLVSLRRHWGGPVVLHCATEHEEALVSRTAKELDVQTSVMECPETVGGGSLGKLLITERANNPTVHLDCDTLVVGTFGELFNGPLVMTEHTGRPIGGRMKKKIDEFAGSTEYIDSLIAKQKSLNAPMVNGGVWGFVPGSEAIRLWSAMSTGSSREWPRSATTSETEATNPRKRP